MASVCFPSEILLFPKSFLAQSFQPFPEAPFLLQTIPRSANNFPFPSHPCSPPSQPSLLSHFPPLSNVSTYFSHSTSSNPHPHVPVVVLLFQAFPSFPTILSRTRPSIFLVCSHSHPPQAVSSSQPLPFSPAFPSSAQSFFCIPANHYQAIPLPPSPTIPISSSDYASFSDSRPPLQLPAISIFPGMLLLHISYSFPVHSLPKHSRLLQHPHFCQLFPSFPAIPPPKSHSFSYGHVPPLLHCPLSSSPSIPTETGCPEKDDPSNLE